MKMFLENKINIFGSMRC